MSWQRSAEQLIRAIAPDDVAGLPLYLIPADSVRSFDLRLCGPPHCLGWTCESADLMLMRHLSSTGAWEGRGFACVIHSSEIKTMPQLLGVCLHEFAHGLDSGLPTSTEMTKADKLYTTPEMLRLSEAFEQEDALEIRPRWHNHDQRFIRAACHLAWRAHRLLESVRPVHLSFASPYHSMVFNELAWMNALGDELATDSPIRDIIDTEPPQAFTERWAEATAVW